MHASPLRAANLLDYTEYGVSQNEARRIPKVRSVPHLVQKEGLAALIALVAVCLLSTVFDAPMEGPADQAGIPAEDVKAPWIFVGIQQILRFLPPSIAGVLLPLVALLILSSVPYLHSDRVFERKTVRFLFFGIVAISVGLTLWGYWA